MAPLLYSHPESFFAARKHSDSISAGRRGGPSGTVHVGIASESERDRLDLRERRKGGFRGKS